jgi:hypothetical protein
MFIQNIIYNTCINDLQGYLPFPLQSQSLTAQAGQAEERIQQEKEQEEVQKQEV